MPQSNQALARILREHGLSLTKPRQLVFELLENSEPRTMHELYTFARGKCDRASLYRTVALFERLGIAQRVNIGWKYKIELSDRFAEHHHHLTCLTCGRVVPISEAELEQFVEALATAHQFKPAGHQIEIQGHCRTCAQ